MRKRIESQGEKERTDHAFVHDFEDLLPVLVIVALVGTAILAERSQLGGGFCGRLASASTATFAFTLAAVFMRVGQLFLLSLDRGILGLKGGNTEGIWDTVGVEDCGGLLVEDSCIDDRLVLGPLLDHLDVPVVLVLHSADTVAWTGPLASTTSIRVCAARRRRVGRARRGGCGCGRDFLCGGDDRRGLFKRGGHVEKRE